MHFAARFGRLETVKAIIEQIEDKNPKSHRFLTPLHEAANEGFPEVVKYLLTIMNNTDLNWTFSPFDTNEAFENPLHCAARKGHLEVVQIILEHLNVVDFDDFETAVKESTNFAKNYGHEDVAVEIQAWKLEGPKRKKLKT